MHEIGVLIEIVENVEKIARENEVTEIQTLVLQVGELSSMVPRYLVSLYDGATKGTLLEGSRLEIEVIPANGLCHGCNKVYHLTTSKGVCPHCQSEGYEILGGKEFMIKEILCN